MESAQDTFKRMMKEQVSPALRALGFKGSGQLFALPSSDHWALLGFQRSVWGSAQAVRFTINLTVVSKHSWEELRSKRTYLGERPAPNTVYGGVDSLWQQRIGLLLPGKIDRWWDVPAGIVTNAVAEEVVAAVRDFALPAMRQRLEAAPGPERTS